MFDYSHVQEAKILASEPKLSLEIITKNPLLPLILVIGLNNRR